MRLSGDQPAQRLGAMAHQPVQAFADRFPDPAEFAQLRVGGNWIRNGEAAGLQGIDQSVVALRAFLEIFGELRQDDRITPFEGRRHVVQRPCRTDDPQSSRWRGGSGFFVEGRARLRNAFEENRRALTEIFQLGQYAKHRYDVAWVSEPQQLQSPRV